MRVSVVSIPTPTAPLDGLFYEPEDGTPRGCVQLLHGQAMNFYVGHSRFMPPALAEAGFAALAYNRRTHDILSTRDSVATLEGSAYVSPSEAMQDNEIAREWLLARGMPEPHLVGHSYGGMLATVQARAHPQAPSLTLLSPIRGGADQLRGAGRYGLLAGERTEELIEQAGKLRAEGRGKELLLVPGWWRVVSADAVMAMLTETPDVLEIAEAVTVPTLAIRGSLEPDWAYPVDGFAARAPAECKTLVLEGCAHFYVGYETQVTDLALEWISSHASPVT